MNPVNSDLPKKLRLAKLNAKRREDRRLAREAKAAADKRLDLREIAPHLPGLRLYDRPVALPEPNQPALCPACARALEVFGHKGHAMLMCEPCLKLWPSKAQDWEASTRKIVKLITPFEKIKIRCKGNERDYHRVRYAANREQELAKLREWRSKLPDGGKRYSRAYYQANKERIIKQQLEAYHANKAEKQAKQAEYRKTRRDYNRERKLRWRQENPEKYQAQRRAYEEKNRERINARKRALREADPEKAREYARKWREANREKSNTYSREHMRRRAAAQRALDDQEQAAD